jgi:hypothetical protein
MRSVISSSFRLLLIGAMMLIAASANLLCVSYDADGQDSVPPVTVELKFISQSPRSAQVTRAGALILPPAIIQSLSVPDAGFVPAPDAGHVSANGSPQFLIPLLC